MRFINSKKYEYGQLKLINHMNLHLNAQYMLFNLWLIAALMILLEESLWVSYLIIRSTV